MVTTRAICGSAQTDLAEDALTGEQLGGQTDHETHHGQAAVPGLSEGNKTEAGVGISHGMRLLMTKLEATVTGCELRWLLLTLRKGSDHRQGCPEPCLRLPIHALGAWLLPAVLMVAALGCSGPTAAGPEQAARGALAPGSQGRTPRYPVLPQAPADIAELLARLEAALRDNTTPARELPQLGHQQQLIYRQLGRQPQLAEQVRRLLPSTWWRVFDQHVAARRALLAMNPRGIKPTSLPAWRIREPEPAERLLAHYRKAQQATGIPWEVLAAINLVETAMGRIDGVSSANAQGPMQFLPSTWAERGIGQGSINNPHDAIQAAARYLVRRGGLRNIRRGLWGYNNSDHYGTAVLQYAALLRDDPRAYRGLYQWQVHLLTSAGDVWLPAGMVNATRIPVAEHLRRYPWTLP